MSFADKKSFTEVISSNCTWQILNPEEQGDQPPKFPLDGSSESTSNEQYETN